MSAGCVEYVADTIISPLILDLTQHQGGWSPQRNNQTPTTQTALSYAAILSLVGIRRTAARTKQQRDLTPYKANCMNSIVVALTLMTK